MKTPAEIDFIHESLITVLSGSLDKIVAFIAFVYFANYFSTSAFGAAYTVIGVSVVASSPPRAVGNAISKRISEDTRKYDCYFILSLISMIVYITLVALLVGIAMEIWDSQFEYLAFAGLSHLASRSFLANVERVFDGIGRPGAAASLEFFDGVLIAILRFGLILGLGFGEEGLLYSGAISALLVGGGAYAFKFGIPTDIPGWAEVENLKSFAGWFFVSGISSQAFNNAPTVLAGIFLSPTVASWIRSAETLVLPAKLSVRSVTRAIFIQVSGDNERGNINVTPIQNGIDVASILALPILAGAIVLGDQLMLTIYGEGYAGTGIFLIAVATLTVFTGETSIFMNVLNGTGYPDIAGKISVFYALLAAGLFSGALIQYGTRAFLIVIVVVYISRLYVTYRYVDEYVIDVTTFSWRFVVEQGIAAIVMAVAVAGILVILPINSWLTLILPIFTGAVVYGIVLFAISARCRRIIQTITQHILSENS